MIKELDLSARKRTNCTKCKKHSLCAALDRHMEGECTNYEPARDYKTNILAALPKAAIYEQLAEECTELAKAALKRARQLRGDNPTPKTVDEVVQELREEAGDVECCLSLLDGDFTPCGYESKMDRWLDRLRVVGKLED